MPASFESLAMDSFDFSFLDRYWAALLYGLVLTLRITGLCIITGTLLGFCLSLASRSQSVIVRSLVKSYVEIIRGVPVLILLFWIFFCLPVIIGVSISNFASSAIALTLFMGATTCETFRAALNTIGKEQYDACTALGINARSRIIDVIAPLAFFRAIPNLLSNVVALFKESSLVSAVGTVELMYVGQNIANSTARPIEVLTAVGVLYFVIGFLLTRIASSLERRILIRFGN
jgi:polar amino acid transport system permease protein